MVASESQPTDRPSAASPGHLPGDHRTASELEASESRYRSLIQWIPIPLWQVDSRSSGRVLERLRAEGVVDFATYIDNHREVAEVAKDHVLVTDVNQDAMRLFGGTDKADFIKPVRYLFEATPDAGRRVMIARFEGRRNYTEEMKVRTFDGRILDVMFLVTFPAPDDLPDTTLIMMLDITDRVRAEAQLRKTEADFAHASRLFTLGELVASIAHEVKQPLTAIAINGETSKRLLSRETPDVAMTLQLTSHIIDSARHASDIIQRIQDMATRHEPVRTSIDINDVVKKALLLVRHDSEGRSINVKLDLGVGLPNICGDQVQLQQVVVNLLVNSIQAIAQNNATNRNIFLSTSVDGENAVAFSIRDTGPGIAARDIDHVFNGFFTTKENGMGIGLSICQSIVMAHGGVIGASNHPEGGAQFRFKLPAGAGEREH